MRRRDGCRCAILCAASVLAVGPCAAQQQQQRFAAADGAASSAFAASFAAAAAAGGQPLDRSGAAHRLTTPPPPSTWQQGGLQQQGPLVVGGMEFSREDDIGNMEKLSNLFGQVFYTMVLSPDASVEEMWKGLSTDVWSLAEQAMQAPSLALAVSMCLYNYFWWLGPTSTEPDIVAGTRAAQLMYMAVQHARCNDPALPAMEFYIQQCHLRWRYLMLLAGEAGRHLASHSRDVASAATVFRELRGYFDEFRRLPNSGLFHGVTPYEVNFNADYYPASVARQGPVWRDPLRDLPVAAVLEANYPMIRRELEAILASEGTFEAMNEETRNAETQFGPRGDDWLTAYMFRKGEAIESTCRHAPKTCELLRSRPEIGGCKLPSSGAGFLRMRPGGRLKPHFGNAPRLSVHLGLIVPDGEIRMQVGHESVRWEEGKAIVFDDTYVHQVIHNGDKPRFVMNLWMCHPCDPDDGKAPGERPPAHCEGPPGVMHQLGLQVLPPEQ